MDLRVARRLPPWKPILSLGIARDLGKLLEPRFDRHGCEPTPEPSTRGVVGITQDVRLKLQILQSMLDYIADADDAG
jgi:hypothetical protein